MILTTVFTVFTAICAMWALLWRRLDQDSRRALFVYTGAYLLTYVAGAILIGFSDGDVLADHLKGNVVVPAASDEPFRYWLLLLAPLVLTLPIVAAFQRRSARRSSRGLQFQTGKVEFCLVASVVVAAIAYSSGGSLPSLYTQADLSGLYGNYSGIVDSRLQLFDSLNARAFGLIYSALPALCHVALFNAKQSGKKAWLTLFGVSSTIAGVYLAGTFQLAPLAVFGVALVASAEQLGYIELGGRRLVIVAAGLLAVTLLVNAVKSGEFEIEAAVMALIFRMPMAFPFYVTAFPDSIPFIGIDWTGPMLGRGVDPGTSFSMAQFVYPRSPIGSAMTAPAHVEAYAQGGVLYAMTTIVVIALFIAGVARVRQLARRSAIWHAFYIQSLVMLYYLTQTSLRGVIWDSYGLYWSALSLGGLAILSLKTQPSRPAVASAAQDRRATPVVDLRGSVPSSPYEDFGFGHDPTRLEVTGAEL